MALRDTIHQIQARDEELSAIASNRDQFVADWITDIRALYDHIGVFLKDLIEDGIIVLTPWTLKVQEDELGEYEAPGLQLSIASRIVLVAPTARLTTGGMGRVDLFRRDRPSESERLLIVRRKTAQGKISWLIEQKGEFDAPGATWPHPTTTVGKLLGRASRSYTALDKRALEDALDYLLRTP